MNVSIRMRRALLMAAAVTAVGASEGLAQSTWDCGEVPETVTATLLSNGTFTISGTGNMKDYTTSLTESQERCPDPNSRTYTATSTKTISTADWGSQIPNIKRVVIEDGVTHIGANAFYYRYSGVSFLNSGSYCYQYFSRPSDSTKIASVASLNPVPPTVGSGGIYGAKNADLYIPAGSIGAYMSADVWKDFPTVNIAKTATVTFDSKGGSEVNPQILVLVGGDKAGQPADPELSGYLIDGWYKDDAYSSKWNFSTDTITDDITLYAKWKKVYFITWNTNGGEPAPTQKIVDDGGSISAPNVIMKKFEGGCTHYSVESAYENCIEGEDERAFGGWYFDADLTEPATFPITNVTAPLTFYAKWTNIGVERITDIPREIKVNARYTLAPKVVPSNATNRAIVWSIEDAGATNADIYSDSVILALSKGPIVLKATIANGNADSTDYVQLFNITVGDAVISVLSSNRVIPQSVPTAAAVVAPVSALTAEFAAGPNPVGRSSGGVVRFFRSGASIKSANLSVYDASGKVVRKIFIADNAVVGNVGRRSVGSWDLTDGNGRSVPVGTYLVRGALKTRDGKSERVDAVVGVR